MSCINYYSFFFFFFLWFIYTYERMIVGFFYIGEITFFTKIIIRTCLTMISCSFYWFYFATITCIIFVDYFLIFFYFLNFFFIVFYFLNFFFLYFFFYFFNFFFFFFFFFFFYFFNYIF